MCGRGGVVVGGDGGGGGGGGTIHVTVPRRDVWWTFASLHPIGSTASLSPLERGGLDSLRVAARARRARVQLDEELRELALWEHGL